jgi:hypothetical protein
MDSNHKLDVLYWHSHVFVNLETNFLLVNNYDHWTNVKIMGNYEDENVVVTLLLRGNSNDSHFLLNVFS